MRIMMSRVVELDVEWELGEGRVDGEVANKEFCYGSRGCWFMVGLKVIGMV